MADAGQPIPSLSVGTTLGAEHAQRALRLMNEALGLIDSIEGLAIAGCHLDQAVQTLQEWISRQPLHQGDVCTEVGKIIVHGAEPRSG